MRNLILIVIVVLLSGCNPSYEDIKPENYEELFPFGGIDKSGNSDEDMVAKECDPSEALRDYSYMGKEIKDDVHTYLVTLKVKFEGTNSDRIIVKYIDNNKELKILGSSSSDKELSEILENGVVKEITFEVKSGYPMYLSVSGVANRGAGISANISAKSKDGVVVVPELDYKVYQNKMGAYQIDPPYCQYIILP